MVISQVSAIISALTQWLQKKGGKVFDPLDAASGLYVRIAAKGKDVWDLAESFATVQSVDALDHTIVLSSFGQEAFPDSINIAPNSSSARAVIFDSGVVEDSPYLAESIIDRENPVGPPYDEDHGTFVASRIVFGDDLRGQIASGTLVPSVKVLSVCTSTHDDIGNHIRPSTERLIRIIRETVRRWHKEIRVYNLSQNLVPPTGQGGTVGDDVVSPLAAELDALAREHRVLFVVTSGNFPLPDVPQPNAPYPQYFSDEAARILPPGEAVLAITTGAIAERESSGSLAPSGAASPFTRRGPGFASFRKPDLVAHGGNFGQTWNSVADLATAGIGKDGRTLAHGSGTSYAAPLITRLAAQLFDQIPNATPELVRALLIHSANRCAPSGFENERQLVGHGRATPERLLRSSKWAQLFVHSGTVRHREIRRVGFYVPEALVGRGGRRRLLLRVTVCYSPSTQRTLKAGYCKSNLRCKLVKRDSSGVLKEVSPDKNAEATLGDRYAGMARLEKQFSSHISSGEWQLLVEHESRWRLKDDELHFATVVEVADPREDPNVDILAAIRSEVPNEYRSMLAQRQTIQV